MPTQPIPQITVNVASISAKDIEDEAKKADKSRTVARGEVDTVTVESSKQGMASSAEGTPPPTRGLGKFDKMKTASAEQKKAYVAAGGKAGKDGEVSEESVEALLEQLESQISESEDPQEIKALEAKKDNLRNAYNRLVAVKAEEAPGTTVVRSASESALGGDSAQSGQEAALWAKLQTGLKDLGIDLENAQDHDAERVRASVTEKFGKKLTEVQGRIKTLGEQATELQAKLKTATSPDEKVNLQKQLKTLTEELTQLTQKKQELIQGFSKFSVMADQIFRLQVLVDLNGHVQQTNKTQQDKTVTTKSAKKTLGTQSAPSGTGGARLGTQSVTGQSDQEDDSYVDAGGGSTSGGGSAVGGRNATLTTASATDSGEDVGTTGTAGAPPMVAANDFSGTTLAIQSTSSSLKSEAKKTDALIKKLLKAALAGNWEAVKVALVLLDKRASIVTIGMGAQTIKAMQNYEKQMSALNSNLGKLKGNEPDYNAKLAKINSEMNMYSMNRQAIANFLRDTMTMREEIMGLTHSVLQKDSQIASKASG